MTSAGAIGRSLLRVVGVLGVTWVLGGAFWLPVAVVVLAGFATRGARRMSRLLVLASAACFSSGLVMTIVEHPIADEPTLRFALDRPLASALGRGGGVLLGAAVVLALIDDRERRGDGG